MDQSSQLRERRQISDQKRFPSKKSAAVIQPSEDHESLRVPSEEVESTLGRGREYPRKRSRVPRKRSRVPRKRSRVPRKRSRVPTEEDESTHGRGREYPRSPKKLELAEIVGAGRFCWSWPFFSSWPFFAESHSRWPLLRRVVVVCFGVFYLWAFFLIFCVLLFVAEFASIL